jgi:hypothetical protein
MRLTPTFEALQKGILMTWFSTTATYCAALLAASVTGCVLALADDEKPSLSQQLANPIADLTSVPIQYNTTRCLARAAIRRGPYRSSISSPSFRSS